MLLACICGPAGWAQEKKKEQTTGLGARDLPFQVYAPKYFDHKKINDDQLVIMAAGNVHAWQGSRAKPELELDCQNLVIWRTRVVRADSRTGQQVVSWRTELYAEKEVRFARLGEVLFGNGMYFDLDQNKGLIIDARYETEALFSNRLVPLVMRAQRFRILNKGKYKAKNADLSTCSFGDPHYRFQTSDVEIIRSTTKDGLADFDSWSSNNVLYVRALPVLYLPKLYLTRFEDFPLKRVETGSSSRFGRFVYTRWGQRIGEWGRWILDVDYRSKRGVAFGPGVFYKSVDSWGNEYKGQLLTSFLRERLGTGEEEEGGLDRDDAGEDRSSIVPERNRYRIRGRHRHQFPAKLRLDLEISQISDRNFLAEFYERELREDKPQESLAYLRKQLDNHQGTVLVKGELSDFLTSTEYLPQVTWDTIAEPVYDDHWFFRRLYWTAKSQVAYLRRHIDFGLESPDEDRDQFRADTAHELSYPFKVGPIRFNPFIGARLSYFSDPLSGGGGRVSTSAGIRISTELHRLYNMHFPLLNINKLMHVITPEVSYQGIFLTNPESRDLFFYDEIDTVGDVQVIRLKLMNRLKTRRFDLPQHGRFQYPKRPTKYVEPLTFGRHLKRQGRVAEFMYFDLELPIFPDSADNRGRRLGDLDMEAIFRLRDWLTLNMDGQFRLEAGDGGATDAAGLRTFSVGVGVSKPEDTYPRWSVFFGNRHARDISNTLIFQTNFSPNPKWELSYSTQYETREGQFQNQRLTLRRYFHRLAVDLTFDRDEGEQNGEGNTTLRLGVNLRGFAERAAFNDDEASELRNQPSYRYIERLLRQQKARRQAKSEAEQRSQSSAGQEQ